MSTRIIDGRAIARRIRSQTARQFVELQREGINVRLDAVMVGDPEVAVIYARQAVEEGDGDRAFRGLPTHPQPAPDMGLP